MIQEHTQIQKTCSDKDANVFGVFSFRSHSLLPLSVINLNNSQLSTSLTSSVLSTPSLFLRTCLHTPAHTHTHTQSHLWWGGVLYFINSRLHAKFHYANLLFSRTQACQLTCGTNFSNPASPSPHPSSLTLSPTPANKYV